MLRWPHLPFIWYVLINSLMGEKKENGGMMELPPSTGRRSFECLGFLFFLSSETCVTSTSLTVLTETDTQDFGRYTLQMGFLFSSSVI